MAFISPILITGAAQRLGLAVAIDLHKQGHEVIVTYRSEKPGLDVLDNLGVTLIHADFDEPDGCEKLCRRIQSDYDALRAVIHNASAWEPESSELSPSLIDRMMNIHVKVPYHINLALAPQLIAHKGKCDIIHFTDYVAQTGSKKHIAYAASKAALENMTLSFAQQFAPEISVNNIAPALLMFNEDDSEEYKEKALKKSLLGFCPGANEAVKAVNYLLDTHYMTGQTLHLNGGRHLK
ncbi:dihydromonapterin reductase [Aestuariibacter sp. AA17]|uniref:Dihydromonapterin reductase n=1 Tax=Fluctibacter corallii TaxID=2984329 RepID=A0ABT3ACA0_9ALTE|nr:dihydromonapterin reductase [Aestuariibacter sp. AA17]MCV2886301.1 dihydromonapterin reductase [Aestuariibacter sp. AA17]